MTTKEVEVLVLREALGKLLNICNAMVLENEQERRPSEQDYLEAYHAAQWALMPSTTLVFEQ